jgi:probable HAF family extracellular repeat protein
MNTNFLKTSIAVGGMLAMFAGVAWAQEQEPSPVRYTVIDLGVVGPSFASPGQPFVITNDGLVSGEVVLPSGPSQAVLYYKGSTKDIGTPGLGGPNSAAFGVNNFGQAVGQADTLTSDPRGEDFCGSAALGLVHSGNTCLPFLWQDGAMTALPTLRDESGQRGNNGQAWRINSFGVAVGSSENTTPDSTCPGNPVFPQVYQFKPVVWFKQFFWSKPVVHELRTISGDPDGIAFAINEAGQAAGASGSCGPFNTISLTNLVPLHAVLWENGKPIDLGNLGGDGKFFGIYATGLNNLDQVVGVSDTTNDASFHGFLWQKGHISDLGPLPGDSYSFATAISDKGVVLGLSLDANFNARAVLWRDGKPVDLNTLIPAGSTLSLLTACSINSSGEIIGIAMGTSNAETHAYLATPIFDDEDSDSAKSSVEGGNRERAKTLQQLRFGRLASPTKEPQ